MYPNCESSDLLILSHSRWETLEIKTLTQQAKHRRVFYVEEPQFGKTELPHYEIRMTTELVSVVTPHLPKIIHPLNVNSAMREVIDDLIHEEKLKDYTLCYHNSRAQSFADHLEPTLIIYDGLEESLDKELLKLADLVFKGDDSFETKARLEKECRKKKRAMLYHPYSSLDLSTGGIL
jgi:hypothetical protein